MPHYLCEARKGEPADDGKVSGNDWLELELKSNVL
jgi:hypothetical protein